MCSLIDGIKRKHFLDILGRLNQRLFRNLTLSRNLNDTESGREIGDSRESERGGCRPCAAIGAKCSLQPADEGLLFHGFFHELLPAGLNNGREATLPLKCGSAILIDTGTTKDLTEVRI